MADHSHEFSIRKEHFKIEFDQNTIRFYKIVGSHAQSMGSVSFQISGSSRPMALFSGHVTHPSSRVAEELGEIAEGIFREHFPKVQRIEGHRVLFRQGKPPVFRGQSQKPKVAFLRKKPVVRRTR